MLWTPPKSNATIATFSQAVSRPVSQSLSRRAVGRQPVSWLVSQSISWSVIQLVSRSIGRLVSWAGRSVVSQSVSQSVS